MIPFRKSIGFRLLGISIILLSLPLLVDSFVFLESHYERSMRQARSVLGEEINLRTSPFHQEQINVNKVFSMISYFLNIPKILDQGEEDISQQLQDLASINLYHAVILLKVTEEGRYVSVGSNSLSFSKGDFTHLFSEPNPFSNEAKKRGFVTSFIRDPKTKEFYRYVAKGIVSPDGKPQGVLVATSKFDRETSFLLTPDHVPFKVDFALLLPSTIVFEASDPMFRYNYFHKLTSKDLDAFSQVDSPDVLQKEPLLTALNVHLPYVVFQWNGQKQLGVIEPLEGTSNLLLAYAKFTDVMQRPYRDYIWYYGTFFVIAVLGSLLGYFGTRRLTAPISSLSLVMHQLKEGNLQVRYKEQHLGFEINRIGMIFNEMVDTLIEKERFYEQERVIKETYEKELSMARDVQANILPEQMPVLEGVEIAQAYIPSILVGGDFYDAYLNENGKLIVTVADASGKGVRACCYALSLKSMLRGFAKQNEDIAEVSRKSNNLFCEDTGETGMFVTVLLGQYDPKARSFDFYSSGHNALIHYRHKERSAKMIDFLDMAMGVMYKPTAREKKHLDVEPGDLLVLYTDGVTETHNIRNELYGDERLLQFVEREANQKPKDFVARLVEELASYKGEAAQHDDITILVLKVL